MYISLTTENHTFYITSLQLGEKVQV